MDFFVGLGSLLGVCLFSEDWIENGFAKDIYAVGITVLSVVFSVYFAGLAIIMSSSDDDFVAFLEKEGDFTSIVTAFEDALYVLFAALLYSLLTYAYTAFRFDRHIQYQNKYFIAVFAFLFLWGLFGAVIATRDSIIYSKYRSRYVFEKQKPPPPKVSEKEPTA